MLLAVARLELRFHAREFLTWIYLLVFALLTVAYTSGAGIELVGDRGAVPRDAPWALAHAMAGVTAFGQVITAFVAASAVLRDAVTGMEPLLLASRLTRGRLLGGKLLGVFVTLAVLYAAVPLGLLAGARAPWRDGATLAGTPAPAYAMLALWLVLPNVVLVTGAFFLAGGWRRSFASVAVTGLGLVALWQAGLALVAAGEGTAGALVDPFGNAAVMAATEGWSAAERAVRPIVPAGPLLLNRLLWLGVGGALLAASVVAIDPRRRPRAPRPSGHPPAAGLDDAPRLLTTPGSAPAAPAAPAPGAARRPLTAAWHWTRLTTRLLLAERGFVAIAGLGALNALANAWAAPPDGMAVATALQTHARVFLILLATIYAGELVWRERDVGAASLTDVAPRGVGAQVAGKLVGAAAAALVLGALLALGGCLALVVRGGTADVAALAAVALWGGAVPALVLVQLTALSLLVHALVQHKVRAHFLLIAAWVLAVALDRSGAGAPLARVGELPAVGEPAAALRLGWFSAVALAAALLARAAWRRGDRRVGVTPALAAALAGALVAAALLGSAWLAARQAAA